jgi:hypothetical protein
MKILSKVAFGGALTALLALSYTDEALTNPVIIQPAPGIPSEPYLHYGMEYNDELDVDAMGAFDSQQAIAWFGWGGALDGPDGNDLFMAPPDGITDPLLQYDAISNSWDALFLQTATNKTAIVFSTRNIAAPQLGPGRDLGADSRGCDLGAPICYETIAGQIGTWADAAQVNLNGVANLDGMEIGGFSTLFDTDRTSLFNDAFTGVSVWTGTGNPYVAHNDVAAFFPGINPDLIDINAMMTYDLSRSSEDGTFDIGDWLMFSLWPIPRAGIMGDEVWVWQKGRSFDYLQHGGHVWNSGWLGTNVDGLEMAGLYRAPLPPTLILLVGVGIPWAIFGMRRIQYRGARRELHAKRGRV